PAVSPISPRTEQEPDTFLLGGAVSGGHIAIDPLLMTETSLAACNADQFAPHSTCSPGTHATPASGSSTMLKNPPAVNLRHGRLVRAATPREALRAKCSRSHPYQGELLPTPAARTPDPRLRADDRAVHYHSRLSSRETDAQNPVRGGDNPFSSPYTIDFACAAQDRIRRCGQ
ncbi:hypothetical protein F5X97DRAFT_345070, partial [Nemania serpens]